MGGKIKKMDNQESKIDTPRTEINPLVSSSNPEGKLTLKIIFVTVFVVFASGIIYIYLSQAHRPEQAVNQINTQEVKNGWKIYRSEVLGLEFSYPDSWGVPYTYPDHITNLNSVFKNTGYDPSFIDISFKNFQNSINPYSIHITLFDDAVPGDTRGLNAQIKDRGYYEDNIADLRKSGDICDYHISYNHNWWQQDVVSELYNKCESGIKETFIERIQNFSWLTPPNRYSYNLTQFAYSQAGSLIFPNVLIKFHFDAGRQQKSPTTYEQFLKDNSVTNDVYKAHDSDFQAFVKSFKSVSTSEHSKTKVDIISSDSVNIKAVKNYYNLLAERDYNIAFSSLVSPNETEQEFILSQKDIYDQVIKDVSQINSNTVEVFSHTQLHNRAPHSYREVFEVTNSKLQRTLKESINGKVSVLGSMRTYASMRGQQSVLVIQKDGKEKIIDSGQNDESLGLGSYKSFYSPYFSTTGKYIVYNVGYYEGGTASVYDIVNDKIYDVGALGEFNPEETLYFACQFTEAYGPSIARIYNVPQFSIKIDLLELHPELSRYSNYKCSNDKKSQIATFEFSDIYENGSLSTTTKEAYRFNSITGEPLL